MKFNVAQSAVNTAIANSIFDLSKTQKAFAAAIFGLTNKVALLKVPKDANNNSAEALKTIETAANTISNKIDLLSKEDNNKKDSMSNLQALVDISNILGKDEKAQKNFKDNIAILDKFIDNVDKKQDSIKTVFDGLSKFKEDYNFSVVGNAGKTMMLIAGGIAAVGLSLFTLNYTVTPKGMLSAFAILTGVYVFAKGMSEFNENKLQLTSLNITRLAASITLTAMSIALLSLLPGQSILTAAGTFIVLTAAIAASTYVLDKFDTKKVGDSTVSWAPAIIAGSLGILALSIGAFNAIVKSPAQLIMPLGTMLALTLAFTAINLIPNGSKDKDGGVMSASKGLLYASASIAVLAMSILVWDVITPENVLIPVVAITALAIGLGLMSKLDSKGGILDGAKGLLIASASIAVLALSIKVWDILGIDLEAIALPAIAITGVGLGLYALAKIGPVEVIKASSSLLIASIAIGVLAFAIKAYNDITVETVGIAGLAAGGLALILGTLGAVGPNALMGAGALLIGGGALWLVAKGVKEMSTVSGDNLLNQGLFLASFSGMLALLGLAPWSIIGAGALGAGGLALYAVGKGLQQWQSIDVKILPAINDSLNALAATFYDIGGPVDSVMIGSGAAAMVVAGTATYMFTKSLANIKQYKLTDADIVKASKSIGLFITSIVDTIDNNDANFLRVGFGIKMLTGLGNMIANLATGLVQMGSLTFIEYGIKDDKIVPVHSRKFTESDFKNVGNGISAIINALTTPLANIGKNSSFIFGGDVGNGIKQVKDLGNLIKGLADGIVGIANLQFTTYEVVNGRLVPVDTRKFDAKDFARAGNNITALIDALVNPLAKIGKGSSWLKDSDVKNGIDSLEDISKSVFKPISEIVKFMQDNNVDANFNAKFKSNLSGLIGGIAFAMSSLNGLDAADSVDSLKDINIQLDNIVSKNADYANTAISFRRTAASLITINKELSADKLSAIIAVKDAVKELSSYTLHENMTKLIELLEQRLQPILSQMNTTLQDAANYAMNQPTNDMSAAAVQHDSAGNIINQNSSTSTTTNVNNQTTAKDTGAIGSIEKYFENTLLMQFLNTGR
jgi:hypothetical protein